MKGRKKKCSSSKMVKMMCTVVDSKMKGYLIKAKGRTEWVPKKLCILSTNGETIQMPEWIAKKKGFV